MNKSQRPSVRNVVPIQNHSSGQVLYLAITTEGFFALKNCCYQAPDMIQLVPFLANIALAAAVAIEVRQSAATQVAKISSVENVAVRSNGLILATNSTYG